MNHLLRAGAVLLTCLLFVQPSSAADPLGKVLNAKTSVYSSGSNGKKTLRAKDPIYFMDKLSTNATGIGEFVFDDGTKVALGPSASLVVDRFVQKDRSTFSKFGVAATKGTFRWISGNSPSAAYRVKTPLGTMGFRGTGVEISMVNGVLHAVVLNGNAQFCAGGKCTSLTQSGDYIRSDGRTISPKTKVTSAFKTKKDAEKVFPLLANPTGAVQSFPCPRQLYVCQCEVWKPRQVRGQ